MTTLTAAILLLAAPGLRLPAPAVVAAACAAIVGLVLSALPLLGAGFATCLTGLHLLAVVSAARVVAERRSYW
ncbi:MAG TPA: hypothetical protein VGF17_21575 [Phytomonospora sp.]